MCSFSEAMLRTCGKSVLNETIEVIDEIEKFIREYENTPAMSPLVINKGKIYDSDTDLLKILDSDNDKHKSPEKSRSLQKIQMPPKKRKFEEPPKKPVRKREECKRGRSAARKVNKPLEHEYVEPKFMTCKKFSYPRKRMIDRVVYHCDRHRPKVKIVKSRWDTQTVKSVVIKQEVIDLTSEEDLFFTCLKFARECYFQEAEIFNVTFAKAKIIEETLCEATVLVPQIHFHVEETCIDLTHDEEITASEKEFANRILPIVFDCHKIYEFNKMANVIHSIEELTPEETTIDNFLTYSLISKHAASLGCTLLAAISHIFVKNLNLMRFLAIVASKIDVQYMVSLKPKYVALYLYSMLNPQRDSCTSKLAKELLQNIDNYVALLQIKQEDVNTTEVIFTKEQLRQLKCQIEQYHVIAIRQEQLMGVYNGVSGMNKEVKLEILNAQPALCLQDIKVDFDVICIDE